MKNNIFKMLQLFAEGEGSGAADPAGNTAGTGEGNNNEQMSFDDFLALEGNQAEFDRRINKAIKTAVDNAQKKWKTVTDDKVSEAEKLAQMTGEEKEKYRADKAEKELAALKKQIALGDMASTARKMLSEAHITVPDDIVMNLVSDDAAKTKEAVESFTSAFNEAVQSAVKEALKGNTPKGGGTAPSMTKEQIMNVKNRSERQKLIAEHRDLFIGGN